MGCSACSPGSNGKPGGCKSNGGCSTGGCNRLNTYDWLSSMDISEPTAFDIVEVSFKNGARKNFFRNQVHTRSITGDMVVVDVGNGHDIGKISLSGELVRMQMKKKRVSEGAINNAVVRKANDRDLERLNEARGLEKSTMVRARVIARTLDLDMKIGDVEYQGDKRKATFYYTADGRVDFRELIRHYAKEFRVKIEMRQIGARQESARIGGIGSCCRELCCSTWLTDFKSVSTAAARYQNLAINQAKLSGQCGRLKCCLNYELDSYMEALEDFPKNVDRLKTTQGMAVLVKTDIFKRTMYYTYESGSKRGKFYALRLERVKDIKAMNMNGDFPHELVDFENVVLEEGTAPDYEDVTGVIELPPEKRRKKKRRKKNRGPSNKAGNNKSGEAPAKDGSTEKPQRPQRPPKRREKSQTPADKKKEPTNAEGKRDAKREGNKNNRNRNNRRRNQNRRRPNNNNKQDNKDNKDKPKE
ncbi:MAG: regulatory iron-sulfur-containing complex subunit RicT [Bacteroidota bacterium]